MALPQNQTFFDPNKAPQGVQMPPNDIGMGANSAQDIQSVQPDPTQGAIDAKLDEVRQIESQKPGFIDHMLETAKQKMAGAQTQTVQPVTQPIPGTPMAGGPKY